MKIVVIEGDDTQKARERFAQIINSSKKKGWQVSNITPSSKQSMSEQLRSNSLFNEKVIYTVENISKFETKQLDWIFENSQSSEANLLIYNKGFLPQSIRKKLPPQTKKETFKIPVKIFKFLESVYPNNGVNSIKLLDDIKDMPTEAIFAQLARHIRDLYWVKCGAKGLKYPDWRISKLKAQASKFDDYEIKLFLSSLLETDLKNKTSPIGLKPLLDLTIARELK